MDRDGEREGPRGCGPGDPGVPGEEALEKKAMVTAGAESESGWPRPGRRRLIVGILERASVRIYDGHGGKLTEGTVLDLANSIESELDEIDRLVRMAGVDREKELEERIERVIEEREQARGSEDGLKAQRDAALNLLRWLIGEVLG